MVPTLRHGDVVLARVLRPRRARRRPTRPVDLRPGDVRSGDVVVGRFRSMPERLVVKTVAAAAEGDGWLLRSDNPGAGGDSSTHGVADVLARVVVRLRARSRPQLIGRGRA